MPDKTKKRAAVYLRVSTHEQDKDGYGEQYQLSKIMNYIDVRDKDLIFAGEQYVYRDLAVSGADPIEERPEMSRLLRDIRLSAEKPFDVVIVYKIDRFARKLGILLEIVEEFETLDLGFISSQESLDTNSPFGKAMLGILGVFSELERDMILERTQGGRNESLQQGTRYSTRRYGYKKDNKTGAVEIIDREAKIVKEIYHMFIQDQMTVKEIYTKLRLEKVPIPSASMKGYRGKIYKDQYKRSDKTVRQILSDELYIGNYYYHKQKIINKKKIILPKEQRTLGPVHHTPIISQKTFNKAKKILDKKRGYNKRNQSYLLSGLLKCDCCKDSKTRGMVSWTGVTENGSKRYKCTGKNSQKYKGHICPSTPLDQVALDQLVKSEIKSLIKHPEKIRDHVFNKENMKKYSTQLTKELNTISRAIIKQKQRIENAKDMCLDGEIDMTKDQYKTIKQKAEKRIKELNKDYINIQKNMEKYLDIEEQEKAFQYLRKITDKIDVIFNDNKKCKKLFNNLIEKIVVYSAPNKNIKLPGRKKKDQHIPHTIMIKFKLPQEFLNNIFLNQDAIDINNDLKKLGTEGTIKKYGTAEHNIRNNKQYLQINGTPDLNRLIREKRQSSDFETTKTLCDESHEKIQTIIHKHTNEELFEKKRYHRTGSTSLGSYLISATSSHYDRAYKFIKKQKNST